MVYQYTTRANKEAAELFEEFNEEFTKTYNAGIHCYAGEDCQVKRYYAERHGAKIGPVDLDSLKEMFLAKFEALESEFFFREATGYECVDKGIMKGTWGTNPESFFFAKLKIRNLWPIPENIGNYDELALFSVIEFLYDYISFPMEKTYHNWNNCGWHTGKYDKGIGMARWRNEMNDILKHYRSGYEFSLMGEILDSARRVGKCLNRSGDNE